MTISDNDQHALASANTPALAFYGKMLTFSRVQFSTDDFTAITSQLETTLSNKNSHIPVLIDSEVEQDLSALSSCFGLGVCNLSVWSQVCLMRKLASYAWRYSPLMANVSSVFYRVKKPLLS